MIRQAHKRGIPLDFKVSEEDFSSPSPFNCPEEEMKDEVSFGEEQAYKKKKKKGRNKGQSSFLPPINAHKDDKFVLNRNDQIQTAF